MIGGAIALGFWLAVIVLVLCGTIYAVRDRNHTGKDSTWGSQNA